MKLNVEHSSLQKYRLLPCTSDFTVDIHEAVSQQVKDGDKLTNEAALQVFKKIEWKADIKAFLAKPIFLIPTSIAILVPGCALLTVTGTAAAVMGLLLRMTGAGLLGYTLENWWNGFLNNISSAFENQSALAREYIQKIEGAKQSIQFVLA